MLLLMGTINVICAQNGDCTEGSICNGRICTKQTPKT